MAISIHLPDPSHAVDIVNALITAAETERRARDPQLAARYEALADVLGDGLEALTSRSVPESAPDSGAETSSQLHIVREPA